MSNIAKLNQNVGLLLASAGLLAACGSNDISSSGSPDSWGGSDVSYGDGWGGGDTGDTSASSDVAPSDDADASPGDSSSSVDTGEPVIPGPDLDKDWSYDPAAAWRLSRPIGVRATDNSRVSIGSVQRHPSGVHYVALRSGSGSIEIDGQVFNAPDNYAHAAIARFEEGADGHSKVLGLAYVDGPLDAPEVPQLVVCDDAVYATINEAGRQRSRAIKLSLDLAHIQVLTITASAELGSSVKLGTPTCGGPSVVFTLDAEGGARFALPSGQEGRFSAEQTQNRSLIVNGRVFDNQPPSVVSATGMRILGLYQGPGEKVFYHTEALIERDLGNSTIRPGDQLIYVHDYAISEGKLATGQGFFGDQDIHRIAVSEDGRLAVSWVEVTENQTQNQVLSIFGLSGERLSAIRHPSWQPTRLSWGEDGFLRVAGTFRSLEVFGLTTTPVGREDLFLAIIDEAATLKRHMTFGQAGMVPALLGDVGQAAGTDGCLGDLDVVAAQMGTELFAFGLSATSVGCVSAGLELSEQSLGLTPMTGSESRGQTVLWSEESLGLQSGLSSWPSGHALWGFASPSFSVIP